MIDIVGSNDAPPPSTQINVDSGGGGGKNASRSGQSTGVERDLRTE